jgi:hypothetical protein
MAVTGFGVSGSAEETGFGIRGSGFGVSQKETRVRYANPEPRIPFFSANPKPEPHHLIGPETRTSSANPESRTPNPLTAKRTTNNCLLVLFC